MEFDERGRRPSAQYLGESERNGAGSVERISESLRLAVSTTGGAIDRVLKLTVSVQWQKGLESGELPAGEAPKEVLDLAKELGRVTTAECRAEVALLNPDDEDYA